MAASGRVSPADNLPRAAYATYAAKAASTSGGPARSPAAIIRSLWPSDEVSGLLVNRAAVSPASTSTSGWAGVLAEQATTAFFSALPASAASKLIAAGQTLPLGRKATIRIPQRTGLPTALPWVAEGAPIPIRQFQLGAVTLGPAAKFATITVMSAELAQSSGAEEIFAQLLREDAAAALDLAIFSDTAATDDNIGGLFAGVTPLTASGGTGTSALESDLESLAAAVAAGGGTGALAFVANPAQAAAIAIRKPDLKLAVWASRAMPAGTVAALDPTAFASGFSTLPEISASEETLLHMESATPLPIATGAQGSGVLATPARSVWQTSSIAVRVISDAAFVMRAPNLVALIEDVVW